ncbi:putative lipid II flippase FtsW [Clostridium neuense]|uniref:Probable peptidoglycan glycosyltransferase FtsW n=1 Tax=Clostridium neuense TaxID=1728934 RepID=A0ABW8TGE2_9CLOT
MAKPKLFQKVEVDFILLATVLLLVAIGVVMVYSASSYSALNSSQYKNDDMFFLKKQGFAAVVGLIALFTMEKIDYHKLKKVTGIIIVITVILLLVVLMFPAINGAKRWIPIPGFNLQPSEIAKYAVVVVLAKAIEKNGNRIKKFFPNFLVYLVVAAFFAGLVYIEHNLSIATVIMVVSIIIMFVGGAKIKHIASVLACGVIPLGIFFTMSVGYRQTRFLAFQNPWKYSQSYGYQTCQSLLALGSGGLKGLGLGQSRQKCYYIPEPYNDFIFSIIGEELGLIGCVFIIMLFLILIQRGIRIAMRSKDMYGTLLAVGITSVIAVQAIINVAVVTNSMPVTGVPLPFISYGGSSIVFNLIAVGVLLNISSQTS